MCGTKSRAAGYLILFVSFILILLTLSSSSPLAQSPPPAALPGIYNVMDFGAKGDGTTDDTAAIQKAIDAAKAGKGTVWLPPGQFKITSLDLTRTEGIALRGAGTGIAGSRLVAAEADVDLIDLTGSLFIHLENFQLGLPSEEIIPRTAILMAQVEGGRSNAFHFSGLYVSGKYSLATLYCYGCPSSDMYNCDFYNYYDGDAAVMEFSRNNRAKVTSAFAKVYDGPHQDYLNTSDWTVTACELHDLSTQKSQGTRSRETALKLDNTMQMRWIGGNISGEGEQLIHFTGNNSHLTFMGTTLYSEVHFPSGTIFRNSGQLSGLVVNACLMQAVNAIFKGDPGAAFDEIVFQSKPGLHSPDAALIDAPGCALTNSNLHCDGAALKLKSIATSILINPGPITAESDSSLKVK